MADTLDVFMAKSTVRAADLDHRRKINFNIGKYNAVVPIGKQQFTQVESARRMAKNVKWKAIDNLDSMLETFERNLGRRRGGGTGSHPGYLQAEELSFRGQE